jgi:hypothetical protein
MPAAHHRSAIASILYDRSGLLRPLAGLDVEVRRRRLGARRRETLRGARRLWRDRSHGLALPRPARDQDDAPGEEAD